MKGLECVGAPDGARLSVGPAVFFLAELVENGEEAGVSD